MAQRTSVVLLLGLLGVLLRAPVAHAHIQQGQAAGFGTAMAQPGLGALGLLGIVAAVFTLVALAASLVVPLRAAWARVVVRVAGSWIAAIGLLLLGWGLRPGA